MALIKCPFGEIYRILSKEDYGIALYNNILIPQVAVQFQNESAKYYLAKLDTKGKKKKYEMTYILTKDFKRKNENLIHIEDILEENGADLRELNIDEIIKNIKIYMEKEGFYNEDIEEVRRDYIKQSLFNRFVKQTDENNHNSGILINRLKNTARMAPIYDVDCCCEVDKRKKFSRKTNDGKTQCLESFVRQYSNEGWFREYIQEVIANFDIQKAFESSKRETKHTIPEEYKERYIEYFSRRIKELKEAYQSVFLEKQQGPNFEEDDGR